MNGSKEHPLVTAGLDFGDKYSYLCLMSGTTHRQRKHALPRSSRASAARKRQVRLRNRVSKAGQRSRPRPGRGMSPLSV
jgi:hypothetical protein